MKAIRAVSILRKNGFNCTIKQILTSNKIIDLCQNIVEDTSEFEDDITPYGSVIDTPIIKLFKNIKCNIQDILIRFGQKLKKI